MTPDEKNSTLKRCVYCCEPSAASRSIEHVIPESLGNDSVVLGPGTVCDDCNNYFSRKVEGPFLNAHLMRVLRFNGGLPSKRGRIPPMLVYSPQIGQGEVHRAVDGLRSTIQFEDGPLLNESLRTRRPFVTWTPVTPPSRVETSRFLAKVAIGYVAYLLAIGGRSPDMVVQDKALDRLRNHARRGTDPDWPVMVRSIYSPGRFWSDPEGPYQRVTEVDLFDTEDDTFLVFAVFGTELTMSLVEPRIDTYERWLKLHDGASPLYPGSSAAELEWTKPGPYPKPGWSLPPS